jgi:hypothetical protein
MKRVTISTTEDPTEGMAEEAQANFREFYGDPEELHPDLAAAVTTLEYGPTMIKHPLVNQFLPPPGYAGQVNRFYQYKLGSLAQAREEADWHSYIFLHERPWRAEALRDIQDDIEDQEYWELLGDVWMDTENLWQWHELIPELFDSGRPNRKHIMTPRERAALARMSDPVTVYRGHHGVNVDGWAWTTRRSVAEKMARRLLIRGRKPMVTKGHVAKKDVIAYLTRRGEWEIVANPENVTWVSTREMEET